MDCFDVLYICIICMASTSGHYIDLAAVWWYLNIESQKNLGSISPLSV